MKHEKIIKRDTGARIKIEVYLTIDWNRTNWQTEVWTCAPGKRTWINAVDHNSWDYRGLDMPEKLQYKRERQLEVATHLEIHNTKHELIEQLKLTI